MRLVCKAGTHVSSIGWERMGLQVNLILPWRKTGEPQSGDGVFSNTPPTAFVCFRSACVTSEFSSPYSHHDINQMTA